VSRRQADVLDRRISGALVTGDSIGMPDDVAPLVEIVLDVRALAPLGPVPREAFVADLRRLLDGEAAVLARSGVPAGPLVARPTRRPPRRTPPRRTLAALLAGTVVVGVATSVASTAAMPGDLLYPVKRTVEDARLAAASTPSARGATELDLARERLEESGRLAAGPDAGPERDLRTALDELGGSATGGVTLLLEHFASSGDPASLEEVDSFLVTAIPTMLDLRDLLPAALQPVADELVRQWVAVEGALADAVRSCGQPCSEED